MWREGERNGRREVRRKGVRKGRSEGERTGRREVRKGFLRYIEQEDMPKECIFSWVSLSLSSGSISVVGGVCQLRRPQHAPPQQGRPIGVGPYSNFLGTQLSDCGEKSPCRGSHPTPEVALYPTPDKQSELSGVGYCARASEKECCWVQSLLLFVLSPVLVPKN